MAFVEIHPQYRSLLARHGLVTAADFLALEGVVCCGHPDRNVARVQIGEGPEGLLGILKREHRTRWRDRLTNAWAGFGLVSKSGREFAVLRSLEATEIGFPHAVAAGEDDNGRAFLLLRELNDCHDLRQALQNWKSAPLSKCRALARHFGTALAHLHNSGFEHCDLYSKHVLVEPTVSGPRSFIFLDWQRARRRPRLGWARRWRDLAALDATLADDLAPARQRLQVLHAYLRASRLPLERRVDLTLAAAAHEIRLRSLRLLVRRRILEMRQPPLALGTQNLVWVDGEALQMTREFRDQLAGQIPDWLRNQKRAAALSSHTVALPGRLLAHLVTRWASQPWHSMWAWFRRESLVAPELESMKVHFHLQRYGVILPRLLAAGQKRIKPWQMESFLLTERLQGTVPLPKFLQVADPSVRRLVICKAARILRQMHQATCYVKRDYHKAVGDLLTVCRHGPVVALKTVHAVEKSHHPNPVRAQRDLAVIVGLLAGTCSRSDLLAGLMAYIGKKRLTAGTKHFALRILQRLPTIHRRRRAAA